MPLFRLGLRLRPRLGFAAGDRSVVGRIAGAGLVGLVLQQVSVLVISWANQQTGDQGALTRFTWASAIYLLPYAVLAAPLLQLVFPRLSSAAETGGAEVRRVLTETGPLVVVAGWLGAGLLVATAVPVARVFVLGPGSGRTAALAWPIVAYAPAVVGFTLLGLASRILLARHAARAAGLTTAVGWAVVVVAVLGLRLVVPVDWLVPALAGSVSLGMVAGAVVGWRLVRRLDPQSPPVGLAGPMWVGAAGATLAGGLGAAVSLLLAEVGLVVAVLGALGVAVLAVAIYAARAAGGLARALRPAVGAAPPRGRAARGLLVRIAQVLTASTGGIGRHVASLVPRLVQRGHTVRVFCPPVTAAAHELAHGGRGRAAADRPGPWRPRRRGGARARVQGGRAGLAGGQGGAGAAGGELAQRRPGRPSGARPGPAVAAAGGPRRRPDAGGQRGPGGRGAAARGPAGPAAAGGRAAGPGRPGCPEPPPGPRWASGRSRSWC